MLVLLDKEGLSNASALDTELETLDGLMGQLGTSEDIFSNVSERLVFHCICQILAMLLQEILICGNCLPSTLLPFVSL